jgi:DNA polymerase III psi subunit
MILYLLNSDYDNLVHAYWAYPMIGSIYQWKICQWVVDCQNRLPALGDRKSPSAFAARLFLVAEGNKISNLKLVDDIFKILEFLESKVSGI